MAKHTSLHADEGRRDFLKKAALATSYLAITNPFLAATNKSAAAISNIPGEPWYRKVTTWGQVNITERDAENYDMAWWRKYWKRTLTKGVIINAGGIVAYYPSKIPLHRHAQYLNGNDLFGKLCKAAHEDGLAVFARMDSNRAHEEFYQAHPDWFTMDINGKPYRAGDLYVSCVNGPYYNEHIPSILTEIAELYKPEGFTDNSWSGINRNSICYCVNCKEQFSNKTGHEIPREKNWDDEVYRDWINWNYERRLEIWDLNNRTTKAAGGPLCIWAGMNSGSIIGQSNNFRDYKEICNRAEIIMLDDQARSNDEGFQHNAQTGQLIHGMLGWDKLLPESMAMYQAGGGATFRLASKPAPEARMWMINGIAGGIQPWWHHVGAYHEDRRAYSTAAPVMKWFIQNEEFLLNRIPKATIGVVWSQQNTDFYGRDNAHELVQLPWQGITQALVRARIPYLPLHADHIERDSSKFKLLILPAVAALSDEQVAGVKRFVEKGGSLICTGETSLYNEWGDQRPDYALADLYGTHFIKQDASSNVQLPKLSGNAYHTYLRFIPELRSQVEGPVNGKEPAIHGKRHLVLKGFEETDILPFGGMLQPLKIDNGAKVVMTFVPQFPVYPPETAWMREPVTDIPGIILRETSAGSRIAFMPADIDKQYARNNLPDHGDLLANMVRWAVKDDVPFSVNGAGLIDCHLYSQKDRLILHLVNLTSAATWRQPLDEFIPIGPLKVSMKLFDGMRGKDVHLNVSNQKIPAQISDNRVHFKINSLLNHELVIIS